ncbi:PspA/IM30 family protein [Erythrobacter sp. Alg231-14]|uniref:PspA/IM30 family protein n=1 Tax=Erythrobacter sp. Alg231-14 TaxID=1922225 RepID=UPI000D56287D
MIHVAVRVRELVSSNLDAIVGKATDPAKALNLLRAEVEETLISLHSELTMTKRQHDRALARSQKLFAEADEWTDKAQIAMNHGREDLARAALQARKDGHAHAALSKDEAAQLANSVGELETAIAQLEAKRSDILVEIRSADRPAVETHTTQHGAAGRSPRDDIDRRLDRIDDLERRVGFRTERNIGVQQNRSSVDAEIHALSQDSLIDAELKAMKAAAKKSGK